MNIETIYNDYRWRPTDGDYKKDGEINRRVPLSKKLKKVIFNLLGYLKCLF